MSTSKLTKSQFAATDVLFRKCCELAKIQPTPRQASKFRSDRGKGRARMFINEARAALAQESKS